MTIFLAAMGLTTQDAILRETTPISRVCVFRFTLVESIVDIVAIVTPEPGCWRYLIVYEHSECCYIVPQTETIPRTVLGRLSRP